MHTDIVEDCKNIENWGKEMYRGNEGLRCSFCTKPQVDFQDDD